MTSDSPEGAQHDARQPGGPAPDRPHRAATPRVRMPHRFDL